MLVRIQPLQFHRGQTVMDAKEFMDAMIELKKSMGWQQFDGEIDGDLHPIVAPLRTPISGGGDTLYDNSQQIGWRLRRANHIIRHYGKGYFNDKTMLEVGAAWGHFGRFFYELGAHVTCSDHYQGWVNRIHERHPMLKAFVQDVNAPWPTDTHYDILVHMGVIYHQPAELMEIRLKEALAICDEAIIETQAEEEVTDPHYVQVVAKPPEKDMWEPVGTDYCLPSPNCIDRIVTDAGMTFVRVVYLPRGYLWFCKRR